MANPEHLAILQKGVEVWNAWRNSHDEIEVDLRGADLNGMNLFRADLHETDLLRADLRGVDLREANLFRAHVCKANLSGAKLREANLYRANFGESNFHAVDLFGANLQEANLYRVDFSEAYLKGSDLSMADLRESNLSRAHFRNVRLHESDFRGAKLHRVDFRGAHFYRTRLRTACLKDVLFGSTVVADVSLSTVTGLDSVDHDGPSTVGIDTIIRSKGEIPDVFLRGCGVPDSFITHAKSLVGSAIDIYSCFISYSHADKVFARQLHDTLQGRGIRR